MANTFKLKTKSDVGVTTVGIYTAGGSTTTVIIGITCANTSGSGIHVGLGITRSSVDDISLIKDVPIPVGGSIEIMSGNNFVLETTDQITVDCSVADKLSGTLSIMEIT